MAKMRLDVPKHLNKTLVDLQRLYEDENQMKKISKEKLFIGMLKYFKDAPIDVRIKIVK